MASGVRMAAYPSAQRRWPADQRGWFTRIVTSEDHAIIKRLFWRHREAPFDVLEEVNAVLQVFSPHFIAKRGRSLSQFKASEFSEECWGDRRKKHGDLLVNIASREILAAATGLEECIASFQQDGLFQERIMWEVQRLIGSLFITKQGCMRAVQDPQPLGALHILETGFKLRTDLPDFHRRTFGGKPVWSREIKDDLALDDAFRRISKAIIFFTVEAIKDDGFLNTIASLIARAFHKFPLWVMHLPILFKDLPRFMSHEGAEEMLSQWAEVLDAQCPEGKSKETKQNIAFVLGLVVIELVTQNLCLDAEVRLRNAARNLVQQWSDTDTEGIWKTIRFLL